MRNRAPEGRAPQDRGPALHVSLLLAAGTLAPFGFVSCASTSPAGPEPVEPDGMELEGETPAMRAEAPVVERAGGAATAQDDQLDRDVQALNLIEQKNDLIFKSALAQARALKQDQRLDEALIEIDRALKINPDSQRARQLRSEIQALLGLPAGATGVQVETDANILRIRREKLKFDVIKNLNDAKLAMDRGDYGDAIGELRIANTRIEVGGLDVDWEGADEEVRALLEQAQADRDAIEQAAMEEKNRVAFEELQAERQAVAQRDRFIVNNLLEQAIDAFDFGDYDAAERIAKKIQRLEPLNEQAEEIRTAAFRAGRKQVREEYRRDRAEYFLKWKEDLEKQRIPLTDVITLPDEDEWREKTALRADRRITAESTMSPQEAALRQALETTTVFLPRIEDETSLKAVVEFIRASTDLPIIVDSAAEIYAADEMPEPFNFKFDNGLTVKQALNRILAAAGDGIAWTIKFDAVWITTREKALGTPITKVHEVKDLTFALTDFIGPRIDRIRLIDELEDEDGGGPYGIVNTDELVKIIELDALETLIRETIAPTSWDEGDYDIQLGEGALIVRQSAEVQAEIAAFLEDLRQFNSALVLIESKFLSVTDNFIQEIGNDFRGLNDRTLEDVTNGLEDQASLGLDNGGSGTTGTNGPGAPSAGFFFDDGPDGAFAATTQNFFENALGNQLSTIGGLTFQLDFLDDAEVSSILRAVEKTERSQVVQAQQLSVHDSQRAYVTVINQRAYIQDFEVEVAQFQAVADPVVNVLSEGIVLDVRPTILDSRQWLRLEIQPTVASIVNLRSFSTTLGGNTAPVEFQLPELEVQSVNTSAYLPDGGTLLLGGLSRIRNIERRAEVPWIGRIPVLGFLFKSEGYNDERESLMIMVKATITDAREQVKELEAGN